MRAILLLTILATLLAYASAGPANGLEQRNWDLVNWWRGQNGLPGLGWNDQLAQAARAHACDMAVRRYFSHNTPEGADPSARARAQGYVQPGQEFCTCDTNCQACDWNRKCPDGSYWCCRGSAGVGENIAAGNADADNTFIQWRNSAGHNANMLNGGYRQIGIGYCGVAGSPYTHYWVQVFGGHACAGHGAKRVTNLETMEFVDTQALQENFPTEAVCLEDNTACVI